MFLPHTLSTNTLSQGPSRIERQCCCGELKCTHLSVAELHQPTTHSCCPFQGRESLPEVYVQPGSAFPSSSCTKAGHVPGTHQWMFLSQGLSHSHVEATSCSYVMRQKGSLGTHQWNGTEDITFKPRWLRNDVLPTSAFLFHRLKSKTPRPSGMMETQKGRIPSL